MRRLLPRRLQASVDQSASGALPARTSIAQRLRWSYLLSSTLPLLIVGALLLRINATAQQRSVYNDQTNVANTLTRSISNYVSDMRQQLRTYMLIVRPGITSVAQWEADANSLQVRNYPKIVDLSITDLMGKEIMRVHQQQALPSEQLRDLSALPGVQQALVGTSSYGAIQTNRDTTRTFTITLPLPNDAGAIVGVLEAEVRAEPLIQEMQAATASAGAHAYLVRQDSGILLFDDGTTNLAAIPDLRQLLAADAGAAEYIGARGEGVIGAFAPVVLAPDNQPTGWVIVAERPASEAFAGVRSSIPVLALLIVLVGALALWWAFREARAILRPLRALREGALALGEGQLAYRIGSPYNNELGDVARTFNTMAEHLQQSLAEIEQQNERLRHGLALARDIQVGLLPDRAPWPSGTVDVSASSIPANEVGGDFYTYLALPEGRAAIVIGDISGKGVGAALMMALTSSTIESQARQIAHPASILTSLNDMLTPRFKTNHMNAALLFAVVDPNEQIVRVANAGMIAPIIISARGSHVLDVGGLPIGAYAEAEYQEISVRLDPEDVLLLVSDGVVEAHNVHHELFGFERLEALIHELPTHNLRVLVEQIIAQVQAFIGDYEQHDDITVVAFRPMPAVEKEARSPDEEHTTTYATV